MKLIFSKKADKQLSKFNPFVRKKILKILGKFQSGERVDIKKMKGRKDEYRIRVGEYLILMKNMKENEFLITEFGKRENIYFFDIMT